MKGTRNIIGAPGCELSRKNLSDITAQGSPMDGAPPGSKTNRDHLIKDNLGRYCPKTFQTAEKERKAVLPGVESRASGLSCLCSVTELPAPTDNHPSLSLPHCILPFLTPSLLPRNIPRQAGVKCSAAYCAITPTPYTDACRTEADLEQMFFNIGCRK